MHQPCRGVANITTSSDGHRGARSLAAYKPKNRRPGSSHAMIERRRHPDVNPETPTATRPGDTTGSPGRRRRRERDQSDDDRQREGSIRPSEKRTISIGVCDTCVRRNHLSPPSRAR